MNRNQKAVARLLELASWVLRSAGEGFTFAQVKAEFPRYYRGSQQADKAWTRDKVELRRMGIRFKETAPGEYALDRAATRPRSLSLTPEEVALLDDVARAEGRIGFDPARHHLHVALRKLALAGAPLTDALDRLVPVRWGVWVAQNDWMSILKGLWVRRIPVIVDYPDSASGRFQRHTVKVYAVFFDSNIFVGDSDISGRMTFFLPKVRSMKFAPGGRDERYEIPPGVVPGHDFEGDAAQLLDGTLPRSTAPVRAGRPVVRQVQRDLAAGYLLLAALFEASPNTVSWKDAIKRCGAEDRADLLEIVDTLENIEIPEIGDRYGPLAVMREESGLSLYVRPQESFRLALRPIEAAMLIAMARSIPGHGAAVETLAAKLFRQFKDDERAAAEDMACAFRFGAPASDNTSPTR